MARRRRKKRNNETISIIGKALVLCLVVVGGYLTYVNYGNKEENKINVKKEEEKKEETTTEEKTETTKEEKKEETTTVTTTTNEKEKKYTYNNQEGEKVTIKADKSVEATGFAGASNHKFFLRGTTLYYQNISSGEKEEIIAYNVEDLLLENKQVTAILSKDGKIVVENNYITYKTK